MTQIKYTGGAIVGFFRATLPFATLKVSSESLDLNVSILGNYSFARGDIVSIVKNKGFHMGVRINHNVPQYPKRIIFQSFNSSHAIINSIKSTGFFDNQAPSSQNNADEQKNDTIESIKEKQKSGSFPLRQGFGFFVAFIWILLFLLDWNFNSNFPGQIMALMFVLFVSFLVFISKDFRKIALKEGKELKDISLFLGFLMFVCGAILIGTLKFNSLQKNSKTELEERPSPEYLDETFREADNNESVFPSESIDNKQEVRKEESYKQEPVNDENCPVIYSVQILASAKAIPLDSPKFKNIGYKVEQRYDSNHPKYKYKYLIGNECSLQKANKLKGQLRRKGFPGAFLVKKYNN
jgi:hypothetical protein